MLLQTMLAVVVPPYQYHLSKVSLCHPNHPCTYGGKEGPLCKATRGCQKKMLNAPLGFCKHILPSFKTFATNGT
jgi:hypothetical protein